MGKLNIAHHKSYHPYRRDNIDRVRRDEEAARLQEEKEEGRMRMADSEARMDLLRARAGLNHGQGKGKKRKEGLEDELRRARELLEGPSTAVGESKGLGGLESLQTPEGHINLFAPLEAAAALRPGSADGTFALLREQAKKHPVDKSKSSKGSTAEEEGVPLLPSKHDLKPWYADEELRSGKEREQDADEREREVRRMKEVRRKERGDPMREVGEVLARRAREKEREEGWAGRNRMRPPPTGSSRSAAMSAPGKDVDPAVAARLAREQAERQRAQALIERKRREAAAAAGTSPYPSSVASTPRAGYRDVYNAEAMKEVEAARRERMDRVERWERERERERGWEKDRDRERERYWREDGRRAVDVGRVRERR